MDTTLHHEAPSPAPLPDAIRADGVGRDVLEARALVLEGAVAKQDGMTAERLAAQRPGGAENRDPSAMGWLTYLCWLHSEYAKGPAVPRGASAHRWDARAMDDMRAALAAEPIPLTLDSGRAVAVYPKGEHALHRIALNGLAAEWVTARRLALMSEPQSAETLAAIDQAIEAEAALCAEFLWIVTHEGPGVPWAQETTWDHTPPAWCRDEVSPFDVIAVRRTHADVNLRRISAIAERSRHFAEGGSEALPLAAFLGVMAAELGVKPEELARRWSLGEVFASSLAKWESTERAKRKADAQRPTT